MFALVEPKSTILGMYRSVGLEDEHAASTEKSVSSMYIEKDLFYESIKITMNNQSLVL